MIVTLNTNEGYFTCDKGKLETMHLNDESGIILKHDGNSYGWDIDVKKGTYNITLKIKWDNSVNHINAGNIVMSVYYIDKNKYVQFKNKKLNKHNGDILHFGPVNTNKAKISLIFNSKIDINILSCSVEYENSFAKIMQLNHTAGRLCITDIHKGPKIAAFYREFNIKKHIPYTDYCIAFNGGCFKMIMGDTIGISFDIVHNNDYKSTNMATNCNAGVREFNDRCEIFFPLKLKEKTSYKVFCKLEHDSYYGIEATLYHAFCGQVGQSKWYYMGTICRAGNHEFEEVSGNLHIGKHNGHLYTRKFKYGNGWDFDHNGVAMPVEMVKCYSDNNYQNSKTEFDSSTYQIKMFLGGGVHTTTPNDSYKMKRSSDKIPITPFRFVLDSYIIDDTNHVKPANHKITKATKSKGVKIENRL